MGQGLPDLLREEGHEGMEELQGLNEDIAQHILGILLCGLILPLEPGFGKLDIPIAKIVPDKVIDLLSGDAQLVGVHVLGDPGNEGIEFGEDPFVLLGQLLGKLHLVDSQVHLHKAAGIPDFINKVAAGL